MIITLLRKPLEGSVAENTIQHGCGGLNIDATRVSTSDNLNGGAYAENPTERGGADMWTSTRKGDSNCFKRGGGGEYEQPSGRWPANFILNHLEGCELRGTKKVKSDGNHTYKAPQDGGTIKLGLKNLPSKGNPHADEDGKEEVADWACVEGCPVKTLDEQSGFQKSGVAGSKSRAWGVAGKGQLSSTEEGVGWKAYGSEGYGDEGGASRFFMQFKKDPEE